MAMAETTLRTKGETCLELSLSEKTNRRFLSALCDATAVTLNGESLKPEIPFVPSYFADLLDAHFASDSSGNTARFDFDDFSYFEMEAVSKDSQKPGMEHRCGLLKFSEFVTTEGQRNALAANTLDFMNFMDRQKRTARRGRSHPPQEVPEGLAKAAQPLLDFLQQHPEGAAFLRKKHFDEGLSYEMAWEALRRQWKNIGEKGEPPSRETERRFLNALPQSVEALARVKEK
jgi:hypothetical protein